MFKKSTLLALAGALTLGVAMLSPVSADAKGFHGGGGGFKGGGFHGGGFKGGIAFKGHGHHGHHHHRHRHPHWHVHYRRHFWVAPAVTYAVARPAVAGPCTCLSKEYTPEGAVLFKDRCTSEMAMNPPAVAPQQTSYAPAPVYQTAPAQPAQPQQAYVPTYPGPAAAQPAQSAQPVVAQ
jgi:hypothetical protein